ncbi:MAG: bifunctional protein : sensor, cNMP-binding domain-like protein, partial [Sphingomonas bacterium]|uniref:cyclic nucleotide-binding domain-containing protein n=1 Tax=Sphingomonas bacterium TaxID=1895847 RepID=UPI002632286B
MAAERTEIDPSDPLERVAQTFPVLDEAMVARMMPYGRAESVARGTPLYTRGERSVDFFVVLEGSIQVLDTDDHGFASVFNTHRSRQFTGELYLFNYRAILVSGRA